MAHKAKENTLSDRVVEFVLSRVDEELATLSVEHIAFRLGLHRSHLSRSFRAEKDFTIEEFIFKIKISRAAGILEEYPDITIKDIAQKIGFCRCDYFIRIFKRYFGTTPSRYRDIVLKRRASSRNKEKNVRGLSLPH
ncbi:MAG: helix-turn-helix transcriptional regulator [Candidatus Omnitrophota bacterium]